MHITCLGKHDKNFQMKYSVNCIDSEYSIFPKHSIMNDSVNYNILIPVYKLLHTGSTKFSSNSQNVPNSLGHIDKLSLFN